MKRRRLTVVSINSRKGGVGKTSIGLSAAAQLAAVGKKVAFVDLDAQGTNISQCIPFNGVASADPQDSEHLVFKHDDNGTLYRNRPYMFWWLQGKPQTRLLGVLASAEQILASGACRARAEELNVGDRLTAVVNNLAVFPASCYVSDLDEVNKMHLGSESQKAYENFLTNLVSTLSRDYEFIFIDNSPGLSLSGATSLSWAIKLARASAKTPDASVRVWTWMAGLASWWEQGLLAYEFNVFGEALTSANPVLIVNRALGDWLGWFVPGTHLSAASLWADAKANRGEAYNRLAELQSLFFHMPLWMGTEQTVDQLLLSYVLPQGLCISVLGDDADIARASHAYYANGERDAVVRPDEAPVGDGPRRWGRRAEEFFGRFFIPALQSCDPQESQRRQAGFHSQVWTGLVKPLLDGC